MNSSAAMEARASVVRLASEAAGWNLGALNADEVQEGSVFLYLFDVPSNRLWVASVPKSNFHAGMPKFQSMSIGDAVNAIGLMVRSNTNSALDFDAEQEKLLALMLSSYISKTQTYVRSNGATLASHFVVIHYGRTSMLRPFALNGNDRFLLPSNSVLDAIHQVIDIDRANHPDWVS